MKNQSTVVFSQKKWFYPTSKKLAFSFLSILSFVIVYGQPLPGYTELGGVPIPTRQYVNNIKALSTNPFDRNGVADTNSVFIVFQNSMYAIHIENDSLKIFRTLLVEKYEPVKKQYKTLVNNEMVYVGIINDSLVSKNWFAVFKDLDKGAEFTGDYPSLIVHGSSDACSPYDFVSVKKENGKNVYQMCIWLYLKRLKVNNETLFARLNLLLKTSNHWQKMDRWVKSFGIGKYRYGNCFGALEFEILKNKKVLWLKREFEKVPVFSIFQS